MKTILIILYSASELKRAREEARCIDPDLRFHYFIAGSDVHDLSGLQIVAVQGMQHLNNAYDYSFVQTRLRMPFKEAV